MKLVPDPHGAEQETSVDSQAPADAQIFRDLLQKLMAFRGARALQVVAHLGIADLLQNGPLSVAQLAQATNTDHQSLYRILRVAAALGVMEESEHQIFAQNECSSYFLSDHPSCLRYQGMMLGSDYDISATKALDYSVQTGESAIQMLYGTNIWNYLATRPKESLVYNKAMTAISRFDILPILQSYDFSAFRSLADVGGGHGIFLFDLLKQYPELQGILFDRPQVISEVTIESEYADRCTLHPGDMFTDVPAGADAYFLKHILHDWGDERCSILLNNCRKAMQKQSTLLVVEIVMPPTKAGLTPALYDMSMMVKHGKGARERTREEFDNLLSRSGFQIQRVVPTTGVDSIIEALLI